MTARGETITAWTVWTLMLAAGLWFVAAHAFTMPYGDEWAWLPVVAGHEPATPAWFWSFHNEHRMVLPRLVYLGLGWLTGFDFRAGAFYNILLLGGLAAAMMLTARSLRRRTSLYDAFFPLLLLHWAQCENIVWGFQLNFVTSVALAGVILIAIVRCGEEKGDSPHLPERPEGCFARAPTEGWSGTVPFFLPRLRLRSALVITTCLIGMGLSGLYGLAYLPALACWLAFVGMNSSRHAPRAVTESRAAPVPAAAEITANEMNFVLRRRACYGLLLILLACVPLTLTAVYFIGFQRCNARPPDIAAVVRTTVQFLSSGIGPAAKEIWPVSGVLVTIACGYAVWQLCCVFRRRPQERVRAAGLFCFLGGIGSLALAIGVGRAFEGPRAGFMDRYMTLAAPLLCLLYFQFTLYSSKAKIHLQRMLCLLMLGLLVVNVHKGIRYARYFDDLLKPLEADMRLGLPPTALAMRHGEDLAFGPNEVFAARLKMLHGARLGPYRRAIEFGGTTVQPLCDVAGAREPDETKRLSPGEGVSQHFDVAAPAILSRIDVKLSRCRGHRTADRLDWAVYHSRPGETSMLLSRGAIEMRDVGYNDFVTLRMGGEGCLVSAGRCTLVFSLPPDVPADCGVDLPLYRCKGSPADTNRRWLKGFVYLTTAGRE